MRLLSLKSFLFAALLVGTARTAIGQSPAGTVWGAAGKARAGAGAFVGKQKKQLGALQESLLQRGLDSGTRHMLFVTGRLNSNGYGAGLTYLRRIDARHSHVVQLMVSEIKDEKERRQQRENTQYPQLGRSTPYIFGKEYNLYTVQLGYGRQRILLPAVLEGHAAVGFRWNAGLSLALLKPYYLRLLNLDYSTSPVGASVSTERYSSANANRFLEPSSILGSERWGKGVKEVRLVPGLYAEGAVFILPARGKAFTQAVTLGVSMTCYAQKLQTLAGTRGLAFDAAFFIGIGFGKGWN